MSNRSERLAARLETHAKALCDYAKTLTPEQWAKRVPGDGRSIGVIVHHVGAVYPLEIQLAQGVAAGTPMVGVAWQAVHDMNAKHAQDFASVTKEQAIAAIEANSAEAAKAIRAMSDADLDRAVPQSLYGDAELTCQFFLEDHAVRHSMHHLASIRAALA